MKTIEFAAQIIIGAAVGKVLFSFWSDRQRRLEEMAADFEYNDETTSELRKQLLLMRYPQVLIRNPDSKYRRMASEELRSARMARRDYRPSVSQFAIATVLLAILGAVGFAGLVYYLGRFDPPGTAALDARDLVIAFVAGHLLSVMVWVLLGVYLTASVVKFLVDTEPL